MGSIGDCFGNAMMESFWARMQVELLNRKRRNTRLELANTIFEYLEIFHDIAERDSMGIIIDRPTWRANPDWGSLLGYEGDELVAVNRLAVDFAPAGVPSAISFTVETDWRLPSGQPFGDSIGATSQPRALAARVRTY